VSDVQAQDLPPLLGKGCLEDDALCLQSNVSIITLRLFHSFFDLLQKPMRTSILIGQALIFALALGSSNWSDPQATKN